MNSGEELDQIMRDLDATGEAWVAVGYGYDTPEYEAREAVFVRLKEWNAARAAQGSQNSPERLTLTLSPTSLRYRVGETVWTRGCQYRVESVTSDRLTLALAAR